jgi:pimeloyl-ACP methyl ester carboxylesterase
MRVLALFLIVLLTSCDRASETSAVGSTAGTAVSADGVSIAYEVLGEGEPALVFVHGWAGYRREWTSQMTHFADGYRVVAIDLAGYGESGDARRQWTMGAFGEDVAAVVKQLGIARAVLIGHSMGTPVILEAARRLPEEVVGLVPVDMLQDVERQHSNEQIEERVAGSLALVANPSRESLSEAYGPRVDAAFVDEYFQYCTNSSQRGWEESLREVLVWMTNEQRSVLREIEAPVYSINSDRTPTNLALARRYLASFDARIIEGVGHSVHLEAPDEFNSALEEVLAEWSPAN